MTESTATLTLTEFLLARIAEDEAEVRRLTMETAKRSRDILVDESSKYYSPQAPLSRPRPGAANAMIEGARLLGLYDQARVLAECEAKRLIVSHMQIVAAIVGPRGEDARAVLTWLALPYADHPDLREEWKS